MHDLIGYILCEIVGAFLARHPFLSFILVLGIIGLAILIATLT